MWQAFSTCSRLPRWSNDYVEIPRLHLFALLLPSILTGGLVADVYKSYENGSKETPSLGAQAQRGCSNPECAAIMCHLQIVLEPSLQLDHCQDGIAIAYRRSASLCRIVSVWYALCAA
jgi:hypothetical protein